MGSLIYFCDDGDESGPIAARNSWSIEWLSTF